MKAITFLAFSLLLVSNISLAAGNKKPSNAAKNDPTKIEFWEAKAKTGMVIATSESNYDGATFFFEALTGSRYGHIGFVVKEGDKTFVYEANPPKVQKTSLKEFLQRSATLNGKFQAALMEYALPLRAGEDEILVKELKKHMGKPYDFLHDPRNHDAIDCSELVHIVSKALQRKVLGEIESMNSLNGGAFGGMLLRYFEDITGEPLKDGQVFVSPFSIIQDPALKKVFSTLPLEYISDKAILDGWMSSSKLMTLAEIFEGGIDSAEEAEIAGQQVYQMLSSLASDVPYKTLDACGRSLGK